MDEWIAGWTMGRFATTVPLYEELRPPYPAELATDCRGIHRLRAFGPSLPESILALSLGRPALRHCHGVARCDIGHESIRTVACHERFEHPAYAAG
jgi:hypothetical protein